MWPNRTRLPLAVTACLLAMLCSCQSLSRTPLGSQTSSSLLDSICNNEFGERVVAALSPDSNDVCGFVNNGTLLSKLAYELISNGDTSYPCWVTGLLEASLGGGGPDHCDPSLTQAQPKNVSITGASIPAPFTDLRPLPPTILDMLETTKATLAWHYRVMLNLQIYANCGQNGTSFLTPEGWSLRAAVNASDAPAMPLMVALLSPDASMLVVSIRGTQTPEEWQIDFSYNQTSSSTFPGAIHYGFYTMYQQLWPTVKAVIDADVLSAGSNVTSVAVAGHSLGAGLATLVSYAAQTYIDAQLGSASGTASTTAATTATKVLGGNRRALTSSSTLATTSHTSPSQRSAVRVDALLFAPPSVGDAAFVSAFDHVVNARRIAFEYDIVPQAPCDQSAACADTPVPTTGGPDVMSWQYASVGGAFTIEAAMMPTQSGAWSRLIKLNLCSVGPFLRAAHTCSYQCWASQFVDDPDSNCLLWGSNGPASNASGSAKGVLPTRTHTFCPGFPTIPVFPKPPLAADSTRARP